MKIRIKNKKRFTIVLSIVLVLIAMISGTYSLFYHESIAQSSEDYTTGILSIVAKSKSDNINLTNALPMTDEEGAQSEPYVFNIENVGNLDYNFKIRLLSTSDNPINPAYIKLKIDDGEVTTLSALTNSVIKDNITLKAKEVMDVSIRIWLASNTPNSEIGKSFNSKIVTEGQAVYTEVNNEGYINLVQHITNLYNNAEKTVVTAPSDASDNTKTLDYNYATSVNLMNDRLGGTTESLDGGNIRYYGAEPDNYIDIGDRTSNNEVILWRIIGVFDGKVRIRRNESIGNYPYDTSSRDVNNGRGINQWGPSGDYGGADLMKLLNPGYETNKDKDQYGQLITVNNSLWWNSGSGRCYFYLRNSNVTCDFTSTGLSEAAKKYVTDQMIYLGGGFRGLSTDAGGIYANEAYAVERGNEVFTNFDDDSNNDGITRTLSWTGKVSLPYPSDYGYAADFSNANCQDVLNTFGNCTANWMAPNESSTFVWLISPSLSYGTDSGMEVELNRGLSASDGVYSANDSWPVLSLSSNVLISPDGDGSQDNPYVVQ